MPEREDLSTMIEDHQHTLHFSTFEGGKNLGDV